MKAIQRPERRRQPEQSDRTVSLDPIQIFFSPAIDQNENGSSISLVYKDISEIQPEIDY